MVSGDCELLASSQSSSCSSPIEKLAVSFIGASSVPFVRRLFLVCAFSDFDWFPSLALDTLRCNDMVDAFFFIETLEPVLGKLI